MSERAVRARAAAATAAVLCTVHVSLATAENLARGRPYTVAPAPNYARCTDPGDAIQLTDGARAPSAYLWLDPATVGWELQAGDLVTLTFDLGRRCRLDSLVLQTAHFVRTDVVPPSLVVAAGDAPDSLRWAGALDASTLPAPDSTRAERVALVVPLDGASARFVAVAAMLRRNFFFTDEVEVHGTAPGLVASGARRAVPIASPLAASFTAARLAGVCALQRRTWAARAALPFPAAAPEVGRPAEESARLAARARAWREAGKPALAVTRVDPWGPSTPWSAPQAALQSDTLHLWPGAWDAAVFEIASAAAEPLRTPIRIVARSHTALAPRATLREVVPVESRDGRWVNDALPLALPSLDVQPGGVRQVWIDVDARSAKPGAYRIGLAVGDETFTVPVRVHPARLDPPPLGALDWTYPLKFGLTRSAPEAAIRDNREHGIDTWWFAEESVPWPDPAAIDAAGHLTRPPDFTACDAQLALHGARDARRLGWYWNFDGRLDDPSRGHFRHPYRSAGWQQAVSEWLGLWLAHLASQGIDAGRIGMQPVDENTSAATATLYHAVHAARPEMRLALTLTHLAKREELAALAPDLAMAIIERRALEPMAPWIQAARARGTEIWTYDVIEPAKAASPDAAYRMLPWEAWARELAGCGFWAYGDTGDKTADAWNDADGAHADWAAVYGADGAPCPLGGEAFVPSKRWQAFRIGLEETALLQAVAARKPDLRGEVLRGLAPGVALPPDLGRGSLLRLLEAAR